ncbi:serine/threonine-protein phosphatase 4 regulatory subunit 2-A-like [Mytilus trossulus]|uniref:serine/threonine-protein phosphatase 4 regulatory subunit 2-A-like n=1 Tax=Mytilus trossulus TaxID=6551 RepID=UPI003005D20C
MENKEDILDALNEFEKKPCTEIPPLLDQYLHQVAKTGKTLFPWHQLKKLFVAKVDIVMTQFKETSPTDLLQTTPNIEPVKYDEMRKRILSLMDEFQGAPFTVQRLCELINEPKRHYKRCDKFLRGIEKNVSVVTTIDPFGRKIVSESQVMVNGLDSNGINEAFPKPSPFSSFPTPTQSAWPSFVDKLFGSNQPKQTQSNTDKEEVSSEGNGEEEQLTEQILPESSNAYETETVGSEPRDEDTNNEDVFTKSTNSPDQKESSDSLPSLSESANLEEKSAVIDEDPEVDQEKEKTKQKDVEQLDLSNQTEETEKLADTCDNAEKTESTQCDDDSDSVKSQKVLDMCEKAQNILDSVNKACSEAEKTVTIAQQVCESDQKEQSSDSDTENPEAPISEITEKQSNKKDGEQKQLTLDPPSESKDSNSAVTVEQPQSDLPVVDQKSQLEISDKQQLQSCNESGDSVSDSKKARLQLSEACESMDVDSNESVLDNSNNTATSNLPLKEATKDEERARLDTEAQINKTEDIPMEQD